MTIEDANYWVKHLQLHPHPEGGFYKEAYRSAKQVLRNPPSGLKAACTSIYYLLSGEDFSGFHRIESDEIWYLHKGGPLHIHIIDVNGVLTTHELSDSATGNLQVVVEAGQWFAAQLPGAGSYVLASCAVAPGFDFTEFKMAKKADMLQQYPQHEALINRLCRL
ncbi:cupin domain-containing protein [Mucilaginibacter calamicampi]|uniref:Cupin domain-containing protein n=1 Tax=Mucilaginibacter calamicampi TaxID=1302352 RepID=A0ABW2YT59_9SPHI